MSGINNLDPRYCTTPAFTVDLIDSIIFNLGILAKRDLTHHTVVDAATRLLDDENLFTVLKIGRLKPFLTAREVANLLIEQGLAR